MVRAVAANVKVKELRQTERAQFHLRVRPDIAGDNRLNRSGVMTQGSDQFDDPRQHRALV